MVWNPVPDVRRSECRCCSCWFAFSLQLYTVVQHVKHFNDVVEFGENQEFTDDFEYLAAGLKSGQPLNTRCLRYPPGASVPSARRCSPPSIESERFCVSAVSSAWRRAVPCPASACTSEPGAKWHRSSKRSMTPPSKR